MEGCGRAAGVRNIVVDDLKETDMAGIGEDVEGLGLDVGVVQRGPLEVLARQLGVDRLARLSADRLDGIRTVLGLLGAGDSSQTGEHGGW